MRSSCLTDCPSMCLTSLWTWLSNSSRRWRRPSRWRRFTSWENQSKTLNPDIHNPYLQIALISTLLIGLQDFMLQHWPKQVLIVGANTPEMRFCVMCKGNLIRHIKLYLFAPNAVEHLSETTIFVLKAHRAKHIREDICYTSSHPSIRMRVDLYILYGLLLE